jgi:hypothetical protein
MTRNFRTHATAMTDFASGTTTETCAYCEQPATVRELGTGPDGSRLCYRCEAHLEELAASSEPTDRETARGWGFLPGEVTVTSTTTETPEETGDDLAERINQESAAVPGAVLCECGVWSGFAHQYMGCEDFTRAGKEEATALAPGFTRCPVHATVMIEGHVCPFCPDPGEATPELDPERAAAAYVAACRAEETNPGEETFAASVAAHGEMIAAGVTARQLRAAQEETTPGLFPCPWCEGHGEYIGEDGRPSFQVCVACVGTGKTTTPPPPYVSPYGSSMADPDNHPEPTCEEHGQTVLDDEGWCGTCQAEMDAAIAKDLDAHWAEQEEARLAEDRERMMAQREPALDLQVMCATNDLRALASLYGSETVTVAMLNRAIDLIERLSGRVAREEVPF